MIKIDVKRPENANMEMWKILFFKFFSWKYAKLLVKIIKKYIFVKYDKNRRKTSRKCKYGNVRNFIFHILLLKKAKFLVKIAKKKNFAKYDKYRRKTSRKCKYGNLKNYIFHILLLKKRQIFGKNSKKKKMPNMINIDAKHLENANMEIWEFYFSHFTLEKTPNSW